MRALVYHGAGKKDWESTPDPEIVEADWFTRDSLPNVPPSGMSIAGRLIEGWLARG